MLRIDESAKTLVAPTEGVFAPEPPMSRDELLPLLAAGWQAFAHETSQPALHLVGTAPVEGVDFLAWDEPSGRVVAVLVAGDERPEELLGRAVTGAAALAAWDAARLAEVHAALQAAVPGDSPRILFVGAEFADRVLATLDWLVRRHGMEANAYALQLLRFGGERLMQVSRAYPAVPGDDGSSLAVLADVLTHPALAGQSAPPPRIPAA